MNIIIENAFKSYDGRNAINIDKLEFKEGNIYAILGLNGSGKSTLLECISGIKTLNKGRITLTREHNPRDSSKITQHYTKIVQDYKPIDMGASSKLTQDISIMVQKPYLFNTSVLNNITSGLKFRKLGKSEIDERIKKYLKYFDMESLLNKNARKLSGGEASKVALLRTAVLETEVTLLDEPTASMDMESTLSAEDLIKDIAGDKRTVIMVTHDIYQARRIADYVLFMDKGRVIEMGEKDRVFNNPENRLVKMLLNL